MITKRWLPARILAVVFAAYLVVRGAMEFAVIDVHDPSTYRHDWGGPSLAGVLAVHCGPAVLILGYLAARGYRGVRRGASR